jgi:hypothetical protein
MSSASLRERWGGQDKSSTSQPAAQAPNTPVKGFHNAGKVILKVSGAPSITEKWSSFHDTAGTVGVPAVNFPDLSEALRKGTIPEIELLIEHEINELVNITSETECMKEIKDILDELNIISSIFKQQLKIVNAMGEDHTDASSATEVSIGQQASGGKGKEIETPEVQKIIQEYVEHSGTKYKKLYQTLKGREQDIEALKTEATRVYQAVSPDFSSCDDTLSTYVLRFAICWISSKNKLVSLKPTQRVKKPKSQLDKGKPYSCSQSSPSYS